MHKKSTRIGGTYFQFSEVRIMKGKLRYFIQEHKVNTGIAGELGMEGGHQMAALPNQHRIALIASQHFCVSAHAPDDGRANEHGFEIAIETLRLQRRDAAFQLAPVSVALNIDVHQTERRLMRIRNIGSRSEERRVGKECRSRSTPY